MSLKTQAKILRILQEQQFERVGGHVTLAVDVRVIAATNKNLEAEIANGNFREDLFYRLNVIPIEMPALKNRKEDLPLFLEHFLEIISKELGEPKKSLAPDAKKSLIKYDWPGNVREVRNVVERICIFVENEMIYKSDLPRLAVNSVQNFQMTSNEISIDFFKGLSLKEAREEFEKRFIISSLEENSWNVARTADSIGIERSNLHRKLRTYKIEPKQLKG